MTERWRFPIGGVHPMAPAVVEGVVYAGGECLYALDARTGEERWRVCPRPPTELVERIFASERSDAYRQMTLDGLIDYAERLGIKKGLVSTTPVIDDGTVYAGDSNGAFYAVNALTGERVWNDDDPGMPIVSSPLILGDLIWAGSINKRQTVIDRMTGEYLWEFKADSLVFGPALFSNDIVYFADAGLVFALPVQQIRENQGEVLWQNGYDWPQQSMVVGDISDNGLVYVMDAYPTVKLEAEWSYPVILSMSGDRLFVAARDLERDRGYLAAANKNDGERLWRIPLGIGNGPGEIANDRIVVAERKDVAAFSILDGTELWRTPLGIASSPTLANGAVYVGIRTKEVKGALAMLNLETGSVLSYVEVPDVEGLGSPAMADGLVYVGSVNLESTDGFLFAFDDPLSTPAETREG
jgi:outer membrane protein assembly factor BamB